MHGVLPLYKPSGISSYDVIRVLQKKVPQLKERKVGHGGTLDPLAEGVLLLLIGEATKLFSFLLEHDKVYEVWIQLGWRTETDDATGKPLAFSERVPSLREVEEGVARFRGRIWQIPPRYSALKVKGKRAYALAREGEEVKLEPREVEIFEHVLLEYDETTRLIHTRVRCSSGTYIRSLARDIGEILGCYGHVARLVRTETLGISLENCVSLETISSDNWQDFLLPMRQILSFPSLEVRDPLWIKQGRQLERGSFVSLPSSEGMYQVVWENRLLALVKWEAGQFHYCRVFHE
ncbi:MAG: tRNA pseudouridine(55) synthase TruB [Brevinematales bacterium]|nr:tRNA pseudouridine(55) synthase TruB [Brevinematales bacterium]